MKRREFSEPRHNSVFRGTPFEDAPESALTAKAQELIEAARRRKQPKGGAQ